jgi:hypothetical protein
VPQGWQTLYLGFGKIRISDYNSTKNVVDFQAGSFMMHTMDADAIATFATIQENSGPWILFFFGKKGSKLERCNVIGNALTGDYPRAVFFYHRYGVLEDCVILENKGKLFKRNRPEGEVTVKNCVADTAPIGDEGVITDKDCRFGVAHPSARLLSHINTAECKGR